MIFGSSHIKIHCLFLGLSIVMFGVDAASAQTHPLIELRGFWIVDEAQSDSIRDKLSALRDRPKAGLQIGRGALSHGRFVVGGSGPRGSGSSGRPTVRQVIPDYGGASDSYRRLWRGRSHL